MRNLSGRDARGLRAREPIDTYVAVETPEQVRFRYQVAGPAQRAAAYLIDLLVRGTVLFVFVIVVRMFGALGGDSAEGLSTGATLVGVFVLEWGYYVVCELSMAGQSVGKRAFNLRVVKHDGLPIAFGDSLLRNLLRGADFLPGLYALGFLVMAVDPRFRRLGDMVAGTLVISEERQALRALVRIEPLPAVHELARLPLKLPISVETLDAIELFLRRQGELSPARELELAEMIAPVLSQKMGVLYRHAPRFLALVYCRAFGRSRA